MRMIVFWNNFVSDIVFVENVGTTLLLSNRGVRYYGVFQYERIVSFHMLRVQFCLFQHNEVGIVCCIS